VLVDTYKFEKDVAIFAVSKEKDVPPPPTNSITITIEADEGYTFKDESSPCTIKVDKDSTWSSIKTKAEAKIELKDDYEKIGWKLGGKDGGYLEDAFVFNNDARVFATSKKKGEPVTSKITITVRGDENIVVATPDNFTVDKGSRWASLKTQAIALATPKENFEIASWHLHDVGVEFLKDGKVFNKDATVFATSKRKVVTYKVEHLHENIDDDEYTTHETEEKRGEAGKNTSAEAKTYEGFIVQSFEQSLIKIDGSTIIQIKYKRKKTSLILDLNGGKATELEDGKDGHKLLKGKYGAKVEVATPTHDDGEFEKWEPPLPKTFLKEDDPTIYVAKWKMQVMRVTIKGDERIEVLDPPYIDFPLGTTKTFVDIKEDVKKKVKLKSEWDGGDYEIYDWRMGSYDRDLIVDETPLASGMRVYVRSNYTKFKWGGSGLYVNSIIGYYGNKPKGRIIIPARTTEIKKGAFKECTELTAVEFAGYRKLRLIESDAFSDCSALEIVNLSRCTALKKIGEFGNNSSFYACKALKEINLTGCSELTEVNLSDSGITSIDLSPCPELTDIGLSNTGITSIDLSSSPKLTSVNLSNPAITSIDLSPYPELTYVRLSETAITSIDLSSCPKIKRIFSEYCNELENINLTGCNELEYVNLTGTAITSIDLSTCPKIKTIDFIWCRKLENINITGCNELTDINLSDTAITSIDLSPCSKITRINFEDCKKLESIDLSKCTALKQIGEDYSYITPFSGCINAEVKLPTSITKIEIRAFGGYNDNYCKKVLVPDKTVKEWVKYSGYPEDRIEMY